jgi:phosphate starvation-inducible PhoH-like protein
MSNKSKRKQQVEAGRSGPHIAFKPLDEHQRQAVKLIDECPVTFLYGMAGTGKTTVAAGMALRMLSEKRIEKIVITRPYVSAGEKLGYLPGSLEQKFDPFVSPVRMIMEKILGKSTAGRMMASDQVCILPLAFMRGVTFDSTFMIMDEAQNSTPEQMHLFLTRLGKSSKAVIAGDEFQCDLDYKSAKNGLSDAINRLSGVDGIGTFEFPPESCQRHGLVSQIDLRYKDGKKSG